MTWPEHYPEACPPESARDPDLLVYRVLRRPAKPEDFLSYYDMDPTRSWGHKLCEACGLSVYSDYDECRDLQGRIPRLRDRVVASARLLPDQGKIKDTPNRNGRSHKTWWVPTEVVDPGEYFSEVEAGDQP